MLLQRTCCALYPAFFHELSLTRQQAVMAVPVAQIQSHYHRRLVLRHCHATLFIANLLNGWSPLAPRVRFGKLSSSARPAVSSHLKPINLARSYGTAESRALRGRSQCLSLWPHRFVRPF